MAVAKVVAGGGVFQNAKVSVRPTNEAASAMAVQRPSQRAADSNP